MTNEHQDGKRVAAEQKMALLMEMNRHIGALTEQITQLPDIDEQKRLRRPLGDLLALVNHDLMRPIIRSYPDLDPDK